MRCELQAFVSYRPRDPNHSVYRLMHLLHQSMERGSRVSPAVYVPRKVWFQHGAKFQAYQVKLEAFELLHREMLALQRDDVEGSVTAFMESLLHIRMVMEDVQNKLAQHLSFIHSIKISATDAVGVT